MVEGESPSLPWRVVDAAGREIEPVSSYLRDRMLGDVSPLTCRSYGFDLLRWYRVLWALDVGWEQATEAETAALVGWLRSARNPQPATRNPQLATRNSQPATRSASAGQVATGPGR
ncbi:hypothetical protein ACH4TP_31525 [Streptomyces sp. NPDC021012]|uniref:hypothetical protein n=1 Tax=Streptomyces sp. NPDC021012 TaxID=3365107 RepID=UPI0037A246B9